MTENSHEGLQKAKKPSKITLEKSVDYYQKNQLNSSLSKMQYTFSKSDKLPSSNLTSSPSKFYDLPSLKTKRSTSFGYGAKTDLAKQSKQSPGVGSYQIPSVFDQTIKKGSTLSKSREEIKFNNMFCQNSVNNPEPGSYNPMVNHRSRKSTIGQRVLPMKSWIERVPGPGNYDHQQPTSHLQSINSHFVNTPSAKFPKTQRLKDKLPNNLNTPGPGNYKSISSIKKGGVSIGNSPRSSLQRKSLAPGPGQYEFFSTFVH